MIKKLLRQVQQVNAEIFENLRNLNPKHKYILVGLMLVIFQSLDIVTYYVDLGAWQYVYSAGVDSFGFLAILGLYYPATPLAIVLLLVLQAASVTVHALGVTSEVYNVMYSVEYIAELNYQLYVPVLFAILVLKTIVFSIGGRHEFTVDNKLLDTSSYRPGIIVQRCTNQR